MWSSAMMSELRLALGAGEHRVERGERVRLRVRDHALVGAPLALRVEHALGDALEDDAGLIGSARDLVERAVGLGALGDEDALDGHARPKRLDDGVATFDLGHGARPAA